jgi:CRP/FNR family transcriptional regulator
MPHLTTITSCASCPVGRAAGVGTGGRCPFVNRSHAAGTRLYVEGEVARTVWFVKRGTVLLSRRGCDGDERPRAVRGVGNFIGLEAAVQPCYADSARTTEATVLCGIVKGDLDRWLGPRDAPARVALEQQLFSECRDTPRTTRAHGTARQRIARLLLDDVAPHIERQDLAQLLGMVPETLSRALAALRDAGAIELTRRTIKVRSRQRLESLASPVNAR